MGILATDNFTRADNADLGTVWDPNAAESGPTGFKIASNRAVPKDLTADCSETYNGVTWPADHYSEVTYGSTAADGAGTGSGPTCRESSAAVTMYRAVGNASGYELIQLLAGASTSLSSGTGTTFTAGDKLKLEIRTSGANVAWVLKKNGVQFAAGTDTSPLAGPGRAGIGHSSTSSATTLSGWEAGDFASGVARQLPRFPNRGPLRQNYGARVIGFKQGLSTAAASIDIASAGALVITGAAAPSAVGTLNAAGALVITGAASLTATGTLAAAGSLVITGTAALTSTGTLASAGTVVIVGAATLTAQGTLAAAGTLVINGTANLPSANDVASAGSLVITAAATLTATGTLASAGTVVITGASALTSIGSVASAGTVVINGAANLTAASANDMAAGGSIVITSSAALNAVGSLAASGALVITGIATLDDGAVVVTTQAPTGSVPGFVRGGTKKRSKKPNGPVMREDQVFGEEYPIAPFTAVLKSASDDEHARKSASYRAAIAALMKELL